LPKKKKNKINNPVQIPQFFQKAPPPPRHSYGIR